MRHRVKGKKLNRKKNQRRSLYRNLVSSLVEHGSIRTTLSKAKAVRPVAEKLVTASKKNNLHARRKLLSFFYDKSLVETMLEDVGPRFKSRPGGYTRIVKLGPRPTDNTEMARLEFVEQAPVKQASAKEVENEKSE